MSQVYDLATVHRVPGRGEIAAFMARFGHVRVQWLQLWANNASPSHDPRSWPTFLNNPRRSKIVDSESQKWYLTGPTAQFYKFYYFLEYSNGYWKWICWRPEIWNREIGPNWKKIAGSRFWPAPAGFIQFPACRSAVVCVWPSSVLAASLSRIQ